MFVILLETHSALQYFLSVAFGKSSLFSATQQSVSGEPAYMSCSVEQPRIPIGVFYYWNFRVLMEMNVCLSVAAPFSCCRFHSAKLLCASPWIPSAFACVLPAQRFLALSVWSPCVCCSWHTVSVTLKVPTVHQLGICAYEQRPLVYVWSIAMIELVPAVQAHRKAVNSDGRFWGRLREILGEWDCKRGCQPKPDLQVLWCFSGWIVWRAACSLAPVPSSLYSTVLVWVSNAP